MPDIHCQIHGTVEGRPLGDPRRATFVCPFCLDAALAEFVGSVGGTSPFPVGASAETWKRFTEDWKQRTLSARMPVSMGCHVSPGAPFFPDLESKEKPFPVGQPEWVVSSVSMPECEICGKPMQEVSGLEWKCGNILCEAFSVSVNVGVVHSKT